MTRQTAHPMPRRQVGPTREPLCQGHVRSAEGSHLAGAVLGLASLVVPSTAIHPGRDRPIGSRLSGSGTTRYWFGSGGDSCARPASLSPGLRNERHPRLREEFGVKRRRPVSSLPWPPGRPLNLRRFESGSCYGNGR